MLTDVELLKLRAFLRTQPLPEPVPTISAAEFEARELERMKGRQPEWDGCRVYPPEFRMGKSAKAKVEVEVEAEDGDDDDKWW